MRAKLSVIIPTFEAAADIGASSASLFEGLEAGLIRELIISDGGSTDAIEQIANDLGATFIQGSKGRGGQVSRGAAVAKGEWLLFLHADSQLAVGWSRIVSDHIAGAADNAACFQLQFRATGMGAHVTATWANMRTRFLNLPYGDQGLLISRTLYDSVGGYPDVALMEDVALARKLKGRIMLLNLAISTSAEKYQQQGWFIRGAKNLWTLARYLTGTSPETLARTYPQ